MHNISKYNINTNEISIYDINTKNISKHNINTHNMSVYNINTCNTSTHDMDGSTANVASSVLYMDVDCLKDEALFHEKMQEMSQYRKQKILSYRYEADQRLSLGAGILLDEGLKQMGQREKNLTCAVNKQGKPYYEALPQFYFNLSHSGHYVVAAFCDSPVGIDIEQIKQKEKTLRIAKRFFHEEEYNFVAMAKDEKERNRRFYQMWTLKESFIKAKGCGMSLSFPSFCVMPNNMEHVSFFQYADIEGYCVALCAIKKTK